MAGVFCGHDYDRPRHAREGVKRAVDAFAAGLQRPVATGTDNTWLIQSELPARAVAGK